MGNDKNYPYFSAIKKEVSIKCLGVWERLVRSLKHTFYAILGNRRLNDKILTTVFCLVDQSLYARWNWLGCVDAQPLLAWNGWLVSTVPFQLWFRPPQAICTCTSLFRRYLEQVGERVRADLNRRSKWPIQSVGQLKTGDLVWIVARTSPRGYYRFALVVKLNFGSDTVARSAKVKITSVNLVRPVVKLAPVLLHLDLPYSS